MTGLDHWIRLSDS